MVKIHQTGLLIFKFEIISKKHFPVFANNFRKPWMDLTFVCQFPNPWALRVSGMSCFTSKYEESQNHCTLLHAL
jgi:hypothetical protein